tara:strand:- start:1603 stop:2160 length:558 start_codon:yes stop_codon:yes gene_type:complete
MLKPLVENFRGIITISGSIKSGKSQLAEFLIKDQKSITYIATSRPKKNDKEWELRINVHKKRRPKSWKLIENPHYICHAIETLGHKESILLDSLGGLVEQHLMVNSDQWDSFQSEFINCLIKKNLGIVVVAEEIGWGIVPATPIGHLFRERHSKLASILNHHSKRKWLAVNGTAIDLDNIGDPIP